MKHEPDYELLVIGGGIHGVGVAQAAAAAGYRVLLLEQTGLAAGTSSKSSKLIHGGLRILESFELSLVRESLRERELLLRLAPSLVSRCDFYLPIYRHTSRAAWKIRAGLSLYAALAGMGREVRFGTIPRSDWEQLDGLATQQLRAVFRYPDAQTNDRLLTQAVMRSAQSLGAELACPAQFQSATRDAQGWSVCYTDPQGPQHCRAAVIVNAAGPWAQRVLAAIAPPQLTFPVENVQGTHLELPGRVTRGCYLLEVPTDRRAVLLIPWQGHSLLGTTEHLYHGDPSKVHPLDVERDYLLDVYRQFFPGRSTEVLDAWSGLRVLPAGGPAFRRSRETQLPVDDRRRPRLISIFGGKLTGYRATALKVVAKIAPTLPARQRVAHTSQLRLEAPDTI